MTFGAGGIVARLRPRSRSAVVSGDMGGFPKIGDPNRATILGHIMNNTQLLLRWGGSMGVSENRGP